MQEYRKTVHRWIGMAALHPIWQEQLDVVKAQQGK
jgi:hypothetical protein